MTDAHAARESDGERASQLPDDDDASPDLHHIEDPVVDVHEQHEVVDEGGRPAVHDADRVEPVDDADYGAS